MSKEKLKLGKRKVRRYRIVPGRPPIFEDANELLEAAEDYFANECPVVFKTVLNEFGKEETIEVYKPTLMGVILHCGFNSRRGFLDMRKRGEEFSQAIDRIKAVIEQFYEEQLTSGRINGAVFALKNLGWEDKQKIERESININTDIPLNPDEQEDLENALKGLNIAKPGKRTKTTKPKKDKKSSSE